MVLSKKKPTVFSCVRWGYWANREIADLAGTTTETVIRALHRLKTSHILAPVRGKIVILNQAELKKLSRGVDHVPGRI